MTKQLPTVERYDASTREWVFSDGRRLPLVAGGDPTATENQPVITIPATPAPAGTPQGLPVAADNLFTIEQVHEAIEKAREQEKNKLYGRLESLSTDLDTIKKEREEQARLAQEAQAAADAERKRVEEQELSAKDLLARREDEFAKRLDETTREWQERINAVTQDLDAHKAALDMERQYQELERFKANLIAQNSDDIMPQLQDLITGNTQEEIQESLARAVAKTQDILGSIANVAGAVPQPIKGIPSTGGAPSGPLENATEQQTLTVGDIKSMSMEQYAKVRDRLLASTAKR